jgi:hypothetical protein
MAAAAEVAALEWLLLKLLAVLMHRVLSQV